MGGSLWFLRGDSVLAREYHGAADAATGRKVDANTIFHWASITKTFTGIAIMQLRDRGRLSLDDPIVKYVPELMAVDNPHGPMDAITHPPADEPFGRIPESDLAVGRQPALASLRADRVVPAGRHDARTPRFSFPPARSTATRNPGIIFLGRVIEKLSGDDFEVYVDKNIFRPLGMSRSYFDLTPYHLLADRSNNYEVKDGQPQANGLDFDTGITTSNGGLNAPLTDMAKYFAFLLGKGPGALGAVPVLRRSSLLEMWRPVLPASDAEAMGDSVALLFFVKHAAGPRR